MSMNKITLMPYLTEGLADDMVGHMYDESLYSFISGEAGSLFIQNGKYIVRSIQRSNGWYIKDTKPEVTAMLKLFSTALEEAIADYRNSVVKYLNELSESFPYYQYEYYIKPNITDFDLGQLSWLRKSTDPDNRPLCVWGEDTNDMVTSERLMVAMRFKVHELVEHIEQYVETCFTSGLLHAEPVPLDNFKFKVYSEDASYVVNEVAIHPTNGNIYIAKENIGPSKFNPEEWTLVASG